MVFIGSKYPEDNQFDLEKEMTGAHHAQHMPVSVAVGAAPWT